MRNTPERNRRLLVGWLVLVTLALAGVSLAWLKSNLRIASVRQTFIIQFDRVNGLKTGDPVEIRGWKVGFVAGLSPTPDAILVEVELSEPVVLTEGTLARLVQAELFGAKRVELVLGLTKDKLIPGQVILGQKAPDLTDAIELVGGLLQRLPPDSLGRLLEDLQATGRGARQLLKPDNIQQLEVLLAQTNSLVNQLSLLTIQMNSRQLPERLAKSLDLTQARLTQAEGLIDSTQDAVAEIRQLLPAAKRGLDRADTAIHRVNRLLSRLDEPGTFGNKVLADSLFGSRLDTTLNKLNQTLDYVRQQAIQVRVQLFRAKNDEWGARRLRR